MFVMGVFWCLVTQSIHLKVLDCALRQRSKKNSVRKGGVACHWPGSHSGRDPTKVWFEDSLGKLNFRCYRSLLPEFSLTQFYKWATVGFTQLIGKFQASIDVHWDPMSIMSSK